MSIQQRQDSGRQQTADAETVGDCPECDGTIRDADRGERVCDCCGLVVDDVEVSLGADWRSFDGGETKGQPRCGPTTSVTQHDDSLGSKLGWPGRWEKGRLGRLKRWHQRGKVPTSKAQTSRVGHSDVRRLCGSLDCVQRPTHERAAMLFREIHDADLIVGRSVEMGAAVAVLLAAREHGIAVRPDEVADLARSRHDSVEQRETVLLRYLKHVQQALDLHTQFVGPVERIPKVCSSLDLGDRDDAIRERAERMARAMADQGQLSGKDPSVVAASCVYAAICEVAPRIVTQTKVADAAGCCAGSIRVTYRDCHAAVDGGETA